MDESNILIPFLKWAGGKRWLVSNYSSLFPQNYNRYIEPFLGSGAVFFHLQPKDAILADRNDALIDTYTAIKNNWKLVHRYLKTHQKYHSKNYYYKIRESKPSGIYSRAARFIYLNRTCWNGLFRVNQKGEFNVPIGTKTKVLLDTDNFSQISELLKRVQLLKSDFEKVIDSAKKNDFLFVDPPYTVKHNHNGFVKYNQHLFSWEDQIRLKDALVRANERNVKILITNANHPSIKSLYKNVFNSQSVLRNSVLSGRSKYRGPVNELLLTNLK